jgi:hypothetical protein
MWRSTQAQDAATVVLWLAWEVLPPALAFLLLTVPAARAAAPWLWPPVALLLLAAIAGLDTLVWVHATRPQWLMALPDGMNPWWLFAAFALGAVAVGWWPVQRLARLLARAYARRWVSDLMVLFFSAWALSLSFDALSSGPLVLLPLLWIPLGLALMARLAQRDAAAAPTLLVLRVFQQDANVSALFDDVVERWRCIGNTVLIAGTDLVGHTLDACDLFDFLDGRLAARFVRGAEDVPRRLQGFDWLPDAEGRFRVNECYCHDNGWQVALTALAGRSDAVLMDLRGFQAHNAGCRFELGVIARAPHVQRVVVLADAATDLATARADAAGAPAGRFVWIQLQPRTPRRAAAGQVMAALACSAATHALSQATTPTPA